MKKVSKTNKTIMGPQSLPTGCYRDVIKLFRDQLKETPLAFIEKVARELERWADEEPKSYKIKQFRSLHKISDGTWRLWLERSERLREANEFALMALGNRREVGAIENDLNERIISFTLPKYDEDYKELVTWRSNLTKQENAAGAIQTQFVLVDKIPDSPLVKPKEEE
jgi:hypothetical protein